MEGAVLAGESLPASGQCGLSLSGGSLLGLGAGDHSNKARDECNHILKCDSPVLPVEFKFVVIQ